MTLKYFLALPFVLASCVPAPQDAATPQEVFFDNLSTLCGQSYAGQLVSNDEADADFAGKSMVMTVKDCNNREIRIPFVVGDDASRTWVITKTDAGLRLKHDHRHEDGSEDAVSQYGGDTATDGTAARQEFPVDQYSIDLFNREGLTASVVNVWAVDVDLGSKFAYELARPNRFFRVEFDLNAPLDKAK